MPIWDSWVVKNMLEYRGLDLRLSERSGIGKREEEAIVVYDKLKCWARTVLKDKIGKDAVRLFDEHFFCWARL